MRIGLLAKDGLLREAMASLLRQEGGFDLAVTGGDPLELFADARRASVRAVVVVEAGYSAADVAPLLSAEDYAAPVAVLIGSGPDRIALDVSSEELFREIVQRGGGARPVLVRERRRGASDDTRLTSREHDIARFVAQGLSNRRIAETTGLREQSVKNLVSVIMRKLGCENRVQVALRLVSAARERGSARPRAARPA